MPDLSTIFAVILFSTLPVALWLFWRLRVRYLQPTEPQLIWPKDEDCDVEFDALSLSYGVSVAVPMQSIPHWNGKPVSAEEVEALKELGLESEINYVHTFNTAAPKPMPSKVIYK